MSVTKPESTLLQGFWDYGKALGGLVGVFEVVNGETEKSTSLSDQVLDNVMMGVLAINAACGSVVVYSFATVATAGEKLWTSIDVLPEVAAKVQLFGDQLQEQSALIEAFGPLLDLSTKVSFANKRIEKRITDTNAETQTLEELRENYAARVSDLEQVERVITHLEGLFPQTVAAVAPGSLKEILFMQRVEELVQISKKEQRLRILKNRLQKVMAKVQQQSEELTKCEAGIAILTRIKGGQISGLENQVVALPPLSSQRERYGNTGIETVY